MISEDRAEKAVEFIRDNAAEIGRLMGVCKALEQRRKTVQGRAFLEATGTVAEREAKAYDSATYRAVTDEIENAWADLRAREMLVKAAEMTVDIWRSQYAASKRGHV